MAVADGLVACGVLATVESPDPHPAKIALIATAARTVRGTTRQRSDVIPGTVPALQSRPG